VLEQGVRTPQLRPGTESWRLLQFAQPESRFDATDNPPRFAADDAVEGTRFALWDSAVGGADASQAEVLFAALQKAEAAARAAPPGPAVADVEFTWLTRPPATFRLAILRSAQVDAAEKRGAFDLLRRDLDLARPAGVRALLDIRPPPLPREDAAPEDLGLATTALLDWRESPPIDEGTPSFALAWAMREANTAGEGVLAWEGRFDTTRLDTTRLS
jgi:hypothetical protein